MASEQNPQSESFMTVAEVATILKLNQQTVRNWIDAGKLPAIHVGRRVRIKRSDFERLIEQGYSTAHRPPPAAQITAGGFWDGAEVPVPEE
jgi:excisionase family DNA binding protein